MVSLEKSEKGKYELAFNFAKGKRRHQFRCHSRHPTIKPQEGFTMSLAGKAFLNNGWYVNAEGAQSYYTKDLSLPVDTNFISFKPFIEGHTSTVRDFAGEAGWEENRKILILALKLKYIGAGFQTPGYPFMMPDRFRLYTQHKI